jgi:hypothetical protein
VVVDHQREAWEGRLLGPETVWLTVQVVRSDPARLREWIRCPLDHGMVGSGSGSLSHLYRVPSFHHRFLGHFAILYGSIQTPGHSWTVNDEGRSH